MIRRTALSVILLILTGCGQPTNTPAIDFLIPVEVTEIKTATVEDIIFTTGTVRTREHIALTIQTPGFLVLGQNLQGIRLAEGMTVNTGDLIAQVVGEDARLAAGIEATREHLESARAELERRQQLFKRGQAMQSADLLQGDQTLSQACWADLLSIDANALTPTHQVG